MKLAPKRLPILLVLALGACKSLSSDANEPAPDAAIPAQAAPAEKNPVDEGELRKKTREVEYARMSLEIAKLAAENDAKASKKAVEAADRELGAAKGERDNFKKTLLALELSSARWRSIAPSRTCSKPSRSWRSSRACTRKSSSPVRRRSSCSLAAASEHEDRKSTRLNSSHT